MARTKWKSSLPPPYLKRVWIDDEEASDTLIGDLGLNLRRAFWYMFDFGHSWWHRIEVQAISTPAPKTKYPRNAERKGKSPPQYPDWDEDE